MLDYVFCNADVLTMCDERPVIRGGHVGVRGQTIAYVGEAAPEEPAAKTLDMSGCILMPGLVNAHAHTSMCILRGYADDYTLEQWLFKKVFPVEARLTPEAVAAGASLGFLEMLRCGVTSLSDMYLFEPAVAESALKCGIRASLSSAVKAHDDSFDPATDQEIHEMKQLVEQYHLKGNGRIRADVSLHSAYVPGQRAWRYVAEYACANGLVLHVHTSETKAENDDVYKRYKKSPVMALKEAGVLNAKTLAAHGVWLSCEDMDMLAAHNASVAHCPVSNLKLGSGIADVTQMRRRGVNVALGTDGCCSNNSHDLWEEIKLCALLQKGVLMDPVVLSAYDVLKMATVGGAVAQGRENEIGSIVTGKQADLICLRTNTLGLFPAHDPVSSIVYSAHGSDVFLTMVQGKILFQDGACLHMDVAEVMEDVRRYALPLIY